MSREVRVGLVGYNFMGRAHSNAYRQVPFYFPEVRAVPVMKVLCGRTKDRLEMFAKQFQWQETETKYERLLERDDIDLVDITSPNNQHVEMVIAAAKAGKHVFCEKPLATNLADAKKALKAVQDAGVLHMLCHNYRRAPACSLAKKMIENGDLGEIYHWRALYLQDWLMSPSTPMMWRVQKKIAGSGSLGDLMAHSIDMALWLLGGIEEVACTMKTFIKKRPKLAQVDTGLGGKAAEGAPMGTVDVDDGVITLAKFANGALGTFEATRFAAGRKNYNWFEVNGSKGSVVFNLETMNELLYYNAGDPEDRLGFRVIQATADCHPMMSHPAGGPRYWPVAHIIGYEHTFINTVADLMNNIADGEMPWPNFEDGCKTQAVLEACTIADKSKKWEKVPKV
ncbi:MAG: Gfo/Idh/MocA family oxidoreductase [Armatimonadetes bacterium]|nr:Gfo/Idh/MocA family oxidoreductase [Armatimonadota bacterium]